MPALIDALERVCGRFGLDPSTARRFAALLDLLASDDHAPTTVRDPHAALDVHLADSLVALELPQVRQARRIADLGSGAGFPGLPLAVALPGAEVALVESNGRKCDFLRRAAAAAEAGNVTIVRARAEEWVEGRLWADLVTARAVAAPAVLLEYAAPLLVVGGHLLSWRGRTDPDAEAEGAEAAAILGMESHPPIQVSPYKQAEHKTLHLFSKVSETPPGYPRRPGVAARRPLGRGAVLSAPAAAPARSPARRARAGSDRPQR
jgi:16S rRNA (guanine527-N7)-methyltransferase